MNYTLDLARWRCGRYGPFGTHSLGAGDTLMLNSSGYECCMGQFARQKGVPEEHLLNAAEPQSVAIRMGKIYDRAFVRKPGRIYRHTALGFKLLEINDDPNATIEQKIILIREALAKKGHTLTVLGLSLGVDLATKNCWTVEKKD